MKKTKHGAHADHAEHGGQGESFFCHVRGSDSPRRYMRKVSSVVSVYLRGLRVSRLSQKKS